MKHVGYARCVEFDQCPEPVSVELVGDLAYLRFRRDIAVVARDSEGGAREVFTATEFVVLCPARDKLEERVRANEADWFDVARGLAYDALASEARARRAGMLAACDFIIMPGYPIGEAAKAAWEVYRQALRDVPEQPGFPFTIGWPDRPGSADDE